MSSQPGPCQAVCRGVKLVAPIYTPTGVNVDVTVNVPLCACLEGMLTLTLLQICVRKVFQQQR